MTDKTVTTKCPPKKSKVERQLEKFSFQELQRAWLGRFSSTDPLIAAILHLAELRHKGWQ